MGKRGGGGGRKGHKIGMRRDSAERNIEVQKKRKQNTEEEIQNGRHNYK